MLRRILVKLGVWLALCFALSGLVSCALHINNSAAEMIPPKPEASLRIATHNAHYILTNKATGAWSLADWENRAPAMDAAFKAMDADIVAYQEMESFSGGNSDDVNLARSYLLERNPEFAAAAIGDWWEFPSTQPIFYRKNRLELVDQGWFFFSDTPDVIYSRTFNGSWPAFASWAAFTDQRYGQRIAVINVHFEYKSASNRLQSAALVADRIPALLAENDAVVLLGDLNARHGSETMQILEKAGFIFSPIAGATYHLNRGFNLFGAIDHIALMGPIEALNDTTVLQQKYGGVWPSDHYPVMQDIRFFD